MPRARAISAAQLPVGLAETSVVTPPSVSPALSPLTGVVPKALINLLHTKCCLRVCTPLTDLRQRWKAWILGQTDMGLNPSLATY